MMHQSFFCRLSKALLRFETWWTRTGPPHLIAIVRIVMGGWLLFYWGMRLPHVRLLYSTDGIVFPQMPSYLPESLQWILSVPEPHIAFTIYVMHLLLLACVTIGLSTRTASLLAFFSSWYYFYLSHYLFHTSFDRLYIVCLLFLSISSAGETFSVEAWRRYGSPLRWKRLVSVFPQRMFALQITMTYLGVALQKLWLPGWQGGEMLWYSMMGVWGTPLAFSITSLGWSDWYHVVVNLLKMMELILPFAFWIRVYKIRWIAFGCGLLFHTLVDLLLYIWWFAVLIPAYIVFFSPEEVYGALRKFTKKDIAPVL